MGKRARATTRTTVAVVTSLALSFSLGGLVVAGTADAATPYVATNAVNVRSGPGTSHKILGVLATGDAVSGASSSNGWVKVRYSGAIGYVHADYLKRAPASAPSESPTTAASPTATASAKATASESPRTTTNAKTTTTTAAITTGTASTRLTTANVNLRTAASLDSTIVKVLVKGTTVAATGRASNGFTEVTVDAKKYWVYTAYLGAAATPAVTLPAVKYKAKTTAILAMRKKPAISASSAGDLKVGTQVSLTGTHSGSYSQIVYKNTVVWLLTGYLTTTGDGPTAPSLPKSAGKRFVNVGELRIRATSATDGRIVDTVTKGTVLLITGKTANKRSQVIYNGALRWAYSAYLSKTRPSTSTPPRDPNSLGSESLDRTNAYSKTIVRDLRKKFPAIKTIYGWRMYSAYSSDHPRGRALDIMIPKYKSSGKSLGDKIARFLQTNHKRLHVRYLIWRQRNWNVERNRNFTTGWRRMSDRGGDTANHYDHVHVSVYAVK